MITRETASRLAARLRRREIAARELLEEYLSRIDRDGPRLNAVVTVDAERARQEAAAADEAAARGEILGPLHGLPITIKDSIETASMRTTCGVPELAGHVPERDATAVARLRAAGAIVVGKTNTPAWAGDAQTYNEVFGTTNNPWDPARSPGGSSGGPAAAVAAGHSALDLGSDLGGSIRMPAGYCGIHGLRPSFGLVPTRGHLPPPPGARQEIDMGVAGPLARGAEDLELALDVLAGPDEQRAVAWRLSLPAARADRLSGYRVAAWLDDAYCPIDGAVLEVLRETVAALRADGVKVDDHTGPVELRESADLFQRLVQPFAGMGLDRREFEELTVLAGSGADTPRARWARHVTAPARDWGFAHERRLALTAAWARMFRDYDVLLCPVTPTTALRHDHGPDPDARRIVVNGDPAPYWSQVRWVQAISLAGLPVVAAPVGLSAAGLPVGIQVVGPYLEDRTVIDFAVRLAAVTGGYRPPPLP
ncbi:amidase [Actinoplanes sp. CA-030573]|uniref:amidase n=1 Tax=Actinoplanes sp. CA-030573 TaxID=3239898 RepID=UPI003D89D4CD